MKYILIVLTFLFPFQTYAEDDIRVQIIDGKNFVCFDEISSRDLFQLRLEYPKLKVKIELQKEKITIQEKMILSLGEANKSLEEQKVVLLNKVGALEEKIVSGDSWYKSPYFLITVGIVAGVALTIGVMYATK